MAARDPFHDERAALLATIEAQTSIIGATRRRALEEALASVGYATNLQEAADCIRGRIAALANQEAPAAPPPTRPRNFVARST